MTISENKHYARTHGQPAGQTDGRMLSFLELLVAAKNESMVFVQGGGRGQTPNPNLNFGSIEIHSGYSLGRLISIFGSKLYGGEGGGQRKVLTKSII